MDIEKAFDSFDHAFVMKVLKNFGFGGSFTAWIKILLNNQELCVINGGNTTQYFHLEQGVQQCDPISAYLFILCLTMLFFNIKSKLTIERIEIFNYGYLYTATFFLNNKEHIFFLAETFKQFFTFSVLKPNVTKCKIAGLRTLKGVKVTASGMKFIDLGSETINQFRPSVTFHLETSHLF